MEFKVKVFRHLKYFGPEASEFEASQGPSQREAGIGAGGRSTCRSRQFSGTHRDNPLGEAQPISKRVLCSSRWLRPQKAQIPQMETWKPEPHSAPAPPPAPGPPSKDSGVTDGVLIYSAPRSLPAPGLRPPARSSPGPSGASEVPPTGSGEPPCPRVAGVGSGPTLPAAASVSPVRGLFPLFKGPCHVPQLRLSSGRPASCSPHTE